MGVVEVASKLGGLGWREYLTVKKNNRWAFYGNKIICEIKRNSLGEIS